jgi:hypothetical protein
MRRAAVILVLAGAVIGVTASSVAQASHRAVVPVRGAAACKTRPPALLSAGRLPHAQLRFDLSKTAGRSQALLDIESVDSRTGLAGGSSRPATTTNTITGVMKTGPLAHGRVPVSAKLHLSGSSYPTRPVLTVRGYFDVLGGGMVGGQSVNDHFPREPVGVGATWRVVNCDDVDQTPAKETRTYTLRSVASSVVDVTYRDVVTIDPGHLDLGPAKVGNETVHFKLLALHGSATGRKIFRLGRAGTETSHEVTRLQITFSALSASAGKSLIHVDVVDTDSSLPVG